MGKARASLTRYHERSQDERATPVWFERSFQFRSGATSCAAASTASTGCRTAATS